MASIVTDIEQLYRRTFGSRPFVIPTESPAEVRGETFTITAARPNLSSSLNSELRTTVQGVEIWMPTTIRGNVDGQLADVFLPYCVVRVTAKKTIVKTPLMERRGSVKEVYSIDDYVINLKGFLIDQGRVFPEAEMLLLKRLFETNEAVEIINPITNIFLGDAKDSGEAFLSDKVVIEELDFPEVEGGRNHVKPFTMRLESDTIFTLEVPDGF